MNLSFQAIGVHLFRHFIRERFGVQCAIVQGRLCLFFLPSAWREARNGRHIFRASANFRRIDFFNRLIRFRLRRLILHGTTSTVPSTNVTVRNVDKDVINLNGLRIKLNEYRYGGRLTYFQNGRLRQLAVYFLDLLGASKLGTTIPLRKIVTGRQLAMACHRELNIVDHTFLTRFVRALNDHLRRRIASHRPSILTSKGHRINDRLILARGRFHAVKLNCLVGLPIRVEQY